MNLLKVYEAALSSYIQQTHLVAGSPLTYRTSATK